MGLEAFERLRRHADQIPDSQTQVMDLSPGSRDQVWETVENLRLEYDGPYLFWKKRGGSILSSTFPSNVLTARSFSVLESGVQVDYIAAHCENGAAYLLEIGDASPSVTMFASGFATDQQIYMHAIGRLLYLFDPSTEIYKVYDTKEDVGYDWLSGQSGSLSLHQWIEGGDFRQENIFGFEAGSEITVFHNFEEGFYFNRDLDRLSFRSFRTRIDRVFEDHLSYEDPSGITWSSDDDPDIEIAPIAPDLDGLVGRAGKVIYAQGRAIGSFTVEEPPGGNERFYLQVGGVRVPTSGSILVTNSDSTADVAELIRLALLAVDAVSTVWEVSRAANTVILQARYPDPVFAESDFDSTITTNNPNMVISSSDPVIPQQTSTNPNYVEPYLFRGYVMVDLLSDGSTRVAGRPLTVETAIMDILPNRRVGVEIAVAAPGEEVYKRYLFATRWQESERRAFLPSRSQYDNSAFFLAAEVSPGQDVIVDRTPDDELLIPMSSIVQMNGGVAASFSGGQLKPGSVDTIEQAMIIGGYRIERPVPIHYTDPDNPAEGNFFTSIAAGNNLDDDPEISVLFEYTDGRKSEILDTEQVITDAEEILQPANPGAQASGIFTINNPAPSAGEIAVQYPAMGGSFEVASYNYANGEAPQDIGAGIVAAINANTDMGIEATGGQIVTLRFKDVGTSANGSQARVTSTNNLNIVTNFTGELVSLDGGSDPVAEVSRPSSYVQFHSLNALVSKVYLLVKIDDEYKIIRELLSSSAGFHGRRIFLPTLDAEIAALAPFVAPQPEEIQTQVDLYNWVVTAIPPQNPLISDQSSIQGTSPIQSIIATQFDTDKSEMRFRVVVFTDRNMQVGYLTSGALGTAKDFEVFGQGIRLQHKFAAHFVDRSVVFQTKDGLFVFSQNRFDNILDPRRFDVTSEDLQGVLLNERFGEYWLLYGDERVISITPDGSRIHEFLFPKEMRIPVIAPDTMMVFAEDELWEVDQPGQDTDSGESFTGVAITRHLGDSQHQLRLLEVDVSGRGFQCTVDADLQRTRLENTTDPWDEQFNTDVTVGPLTTYMYGTPFIFTQRAVMPKLRLTLSGNSESLVSEVKLRHLVTQNKGRAR